MLKTKMLIALPAVALMLASTPQSADARTKTILKYGAIGLGAAALGNYMQQRSYSQPYYGGGYYYQQPYYGGYYSSYPSYGYSYPSYGYGGGYGSYYGGGYYGY